MKQLNEIQIFSCHIELCKVNAYVKIFNILLLRFFTCPVEWRKGKMEVLNLFPFSNFVIVRNNNWKCLLEGNLNLASLGKNCQSLIFVLLLLWSLSWWWVSGGGGWWLWLLGPRWGEVGNCSPISMLCGSESWPAFAAVVSHVCTITRGPADIRDQWRQQLVEGTVWVICLLSQGPDVLSGWLVHTTAFPGSVASLTPGGSPWLCIGPLVLMVTLSSLILIQNLSWFLYPFQSMWEFQASFQTTEELRLA